MLHAYKIKVFAILIYTNVDEKETKKLLENTDFDYVFLLKIIKSDETKKFIDLVPVFQINYLSLYYRYLPLI